MKKRKQEVPMPDKWRCNVCGYVHIDTEPPDICPVCGAPKSAFEKIE